MYLKREDFIIVTQENKDSKMDYFFSADMQKVMMLPYITGVKSRTFSKRLLIFAPLGQQKTKQNKNTTKGRVL